MASELISFQWALTVTVLQIMISSKQDFPDLSFLHSAKDPATFSEW